MPDYLLVYQEAYRSYRLCALEEFYILKVLLGGINMARMHARTKGKSASQRPAGRPVPEGSPSAKQVEEEILLLAKQGHSPSYIGTLLKEKGILDVKAITQKKVSVILSEHGLSLELPEDLRNLIQKAIMLRKHLKENHKDQPAKRGLTLTEAKIQRVAKHHKSTNKLPTSWKYDWKQFNYLAE